MQYEKLSDKLYTMRIDGVLTDIKCPYAKTEALFKTFVGSGGMISPTGEVQNDIISLISNFTNVGNILLSVYGPRGEILEQGDCSLLSTQEIICLFEIASDIVQTFISDISQSNQKKASEMSEVKEAKKVTKKDSQ